MVTQRDIAQASPESVRAVHAWLSRSRDFVSHATVHETHATHRSLHATKPIPPSTPILRIPPSHLISSRLAHGTPHVSSILRAVKRDGVEDRIPDAAGDSAALLLFLMGELVAGERSRYFIWFRSLPARFVNPLTVGAGVVGRLLGGTPLEGLVEVLRRELREMYWEWLIPYAVEAHPELYPRELCTWEAFLRVHCIIESRAFKIDDVTMLVPMADMANHHPRDSARCNARARGWEVEGLTEGKGLELVTREGGLAEGEEVCISYGALENWQLLLHYGFAIEQNRADGVDVELEVPSGECGRVYMTKMLFLGMAGGGVEVEHRLKMEDALPAGLVASARLLCLDEEEVGRVTVRGTDFYRVVSERNERVMRRKLREMLAALAERFTERRVEEGADVGCEEFARYCGCYVRVQREIIAGALRKLEDMERDGEGAV